MNDFIVNYCYIWKFIIYFDQQVCNSDNFLQILSKDVFRMLEKAENMKRSYGVLFRDSWDEYMLIIYQINFRNIFFVKIGVDIRIDIIFQKIFSIVDFFYICVKCGKIFWEGLYMVLVCEQFVYVLNLQFLMFIGVCGILYQLCILYWVLDKIF